MSKIPISEIFGPTIQGEGPLAGLPCHFVRFGGCDFKCIWCDSEHAVLPELVRKLQRMDVTEILVQLQLLGGSPKWIIFSGGNPLLHELEPLVLEIRRRQWKIQVETQGTLWKPWLLKVQKVVVSPKAPSSEMDQPVTQVRTFINRCDPKTLALKVVVFDERDYEYAQLIHRSFTEIEFFVSVGDRMGGLANRAFGGAKDTPGLLANRYRWLCERVAQDPIMGTVRVLPQLHKLAWGEERGR